MRIDKVAKMASDDAARWAYAEMFHGPGAGINRRLLGAEIAQKVERISGYHQIFTEAYREQPFGKLAVKAAKERKRLDRNNAIGRNVGALMRGDRRSMTNGFAALVVVGSVAHATGYDKKAYDFLKGEAKIAKKKFDKWNTARKPGPKRVPFGDVPAGPNRFA